MIFSTFSFNIFLWCVRII